MMIAESEMPNEFEFTYVPIDAQYCNIGLRFFMFFTKIFRGRIIHKVDLYTSNNGILNVHSVTFQ